MTLYIISVFFDILRLSSFFIDENIGNELSWWLEMAPENKAIYEENDIEHNVSDIDAFYDYLVELSSQSNK